MNSADAPHLKLCIDRDFDRLGFDRSQLACKEIELGESERLSAEALLIVVATYVGRRLLDKATDGALDQALDKIVAFARSKKKRLKLELESRDVDQRVSAFIASIESIDRAEFSRALAALPDLRALTDKLLSANGEHWRELVFIWTDGEWQYSFGITSDGEIVEDQTLLLGP